MRGIAPVRHATRSPSVTAQLRPPPLAGLSASALKGNSKLFGIRVATVEKPGQLSKFAFWVGLPSMNHLSIP